ncbi:hypothetical protein, partial [Tropicibacter alexandrii]|uniref:hypothetical protein n=1 Tax=Tropicibacter alexandrii TaxID=2267683 RepID=UPI00197F0A8D
PTVSPRASQKTAPPDQAPSPKIPHSSCAKIVNNLVHYPSEQQDARSRIAENRHKLFGDRSVIIAIKPELQNPSL